MACTLEHKDYGFNPGFLEFIQDRMNFRFTGAQAIKALGISKAKFYKDIREGALTCMHSPVRKRRLFTGRSLHDYYLTQC